MTSAVGVNAGQGVNLLTAHGADDAPDEAKGVPCIALPRQPLTCRVGELGEVTRRRSDGGGQHINQGAGREGEIAPVASEARRNCAATVGFQHGPLSAAIQRPPREHGSSLTEGAPMSDEPPRHRTGGDPMRDNPLTAAQEAAETRLEEIAEDRKWWRERGGTDSDSDRAGDAYEAELDRMGGSA